MQKKKNKIIVILGPTASGKSSLAVEIASHFQGEIISADSRQIYRHTEINTGAVPINKDPYKNIPHHLISFLSLNKNFNVVDFQKKTTELIPRIFKKNKLPIICGGSIFWIYALIKGQQFPQVQPNFHLRKQLEQKTASQLFQKLKKRNPQQAHRIGPHNKIRLIRALEIINSLGDIPPLQYNPPPYDFIFLYPYYNWEELKKRIKKNVEIRWKQNMIEEIKRLNEKGYTWKQIERLGLSFYLISQFLKKEPNTDENLKKLKEKIYLAEKNYAKRQLTWIKKFKKTKTIHLIKNKSIAISLLKNKTTF